MSKKLKKKIDEMCIGAQISKKKDKSAGGLNGFMSNKKLKHLLQLLDDIKSGNYIVDDED